jgi:hypothetical protein
MYARVTETVTNRGRQAASYSPASGPGPAPTALAMPRMCPRASKPPPHPQNSPRSIPPDDRFPDPGPRTDLGNAQTGPLARLRQGCTDGHAAPPQPRRPAHRPPGQHAGRSRAPHVTRPPPRTGRLVLLAASRPVSRPPGRPPPSRPRRPDSPKTRPGLAAAIPVISCTARTGDQARCPYPYHPPRQAPSSAARTHRSPSQPPARSAHHQPAAPHISATRTQPPAQSTHPIPRTHPARTRHHGPPRWQPTPVNPSGAETSSSCISCNLGNSTPARTFTSLRVDICARLAECLPTCVPLRARSRWPASLLTRRR